MIPKIKRLVAPTGIGDGVGEGEGVGVGVGLGNGEGVGEGVGVGCLIAPVILPLAHPARQIKTTQLNTEQKTRNNHLLLMGPFPCTECFTAYKRSDAQSCGNAVRSYGIIQQAQGFLQSHPFHRRPFFQNNLNCRLQVDTQEQQ